MPVPASGSSKSSETDAPGAALPFPTANTKPPLTGWGTPSRQRRLRIRSREGQRGARASVSELLDDPEAGTGTKVGFAAARAGSLRSDSSRPRRRRLPLAVWASALANAGANNRWVEASRGFGSRSRTIFAGAIGLGLICTIAGVIFQGALASGIGPLDALDPSVIGEVLDTRFGEVRAIRFGIWVALAVISRSPYRRGARRRRCAQPPWERREPPSRRRPGRWSGRWGTPRRPRGDSRFRGTCVKSRSDLGARPLHHRPRDRYERLGRRARDARCRATCRHPQPRASRPNEALAACLRRFSPIALGAVIVLLATGILQSLLELDSLSALVDTAFGRLILVKSALLAALIGLGAVNRRRSSRRWTHWRGAARRRDPRASRPEDPPRRGRTGRRCDRRDVVPRPPSAERRIRRWARLRVC